MPVFRVNKTKDYTAMSNSHFREKEMSLKAKGLLSLMLSLPDEWDYSIEGISKLSSDGESSVRSTMKELEKLGFLHRAKIKDKCGKFNDVVYDIYENPSINPKCDFPHVEKPHVEKPHVENQRQYNTNKSNTKESKKDPPIGVSKEKPTKTESVRHKYGEYKNVMFTDEQMDKLKSEYPLDHEERIERLSEYMASTGKTYKDHLATIRVWAKKEKPQSKLKSELGAKEGKFFSSLGNIENMTDEERDTEYARLEEKLRKKDCK